MFMDVDCAELVFEEGGFPQLRAIQVRFMKNKKTTFISYQQLSIIIISGTAAKE
jgi:hypothetical protein